MARDENPPFPLGATYFGGDSSVIDSTDGFQMEGVEYEFEDIDLTNGTIGAAPNRSNKRRRLRAVRNVNATALLPSQLAKFNLSGSKDNIIGQVNGVSATVADKCAPADEWLTSAGCLENDICWVVMDGLANVLTSSGGTTDIAAIGDVVIPGAGGGVVLQDTSATGAGLFESIQNRVGRAAATVNATSTAFLVNVQIHGG